MGKRRMTTQGNSRVYTTKLTTVMNMPGFATGFNEVLRGKPADFDAWADDKNKAWAYERGRLLGVVYKGKLKDGRKFLFAAVAAFSAALKEKAIT